MTRKLSIGTWAYIFNQEVPTNDFHVIVHKLSDLGYEGVELGGFNPHPGPDTCATREKRQELRKLVKDHGLEFSGLAADLWSQKLLSVEDSGMGDLLRYDAERLRILVERHHLFTGSLLARWLLDDWDSALARFVKVMPRDYRRVLLEREAERQAEEAAAAE